MLDILIDHAVESTIAGIVGIAGWAASVELRLRNTGRRLVGDDDDPNNMGALETIATLDEDVERLDEKVGALDDKVDSIDAKLDETHETVVDKLDSIDQNTTKD